MAGGQDPRAVRAEDGTVNGLGVAGENGEGLQPAERIAQRLFGLSGVTHAQPGQREQRAERRIATNVLFRLGRKQARLRRVRVGERARTLDQSDDSSHQGGGSERNESRCRGAPDPNRSALLNDLLAGQFVLRLPMQRRRKVRYRISESGVIE